MIRIDIIIFIPGEATVSYVQHKLPVSDRGDSISLYYSVRLCKTQEDPSFINEVLFHLSGVRNDQSLF